MNDFLLYSEEGPSIYSIFLQSIFGLENLSSFCSSISLLLSVKKIFAASMDPMLLFVANFSVTLKGRLDEEELK